MKNKSFRRFLVTGLTLTLVGFQTLPNDTVKAQATDSAPQMLTGELSPVGDVTINGLKAMPGDTVLNGTVLRTGCDGNAVINLGRLGRFELGPGSEMVVNLSENAPGGELRSGTLTVSTPVGIAPAIMTEQGLVTSGGQEVSVFIVDRTMGNTRVASRRSDVRLSSGNKMEYISAGQEAAVGTQNPGQGARCARLGAAGGTGAGGGGAIPGVGGVSGGALAALIIAGVGAVAATAVAVAESDNVTAQQLVVSTFIP